MRTFAIAVTLTTGLWAGANQGPRPSPSAGVGARAAVTVVGTVTDAASGSPLFGASVVLGGGSTAARSNAAGRWSVPLDDSWSGRTVDISVSLVGYAHATRALTLSAGTNVVDVALQPIPFVPEMARDAPLNEAREAFARRADVVLAASRAEAEWQLPPVPFNTESYAVIRDNAFTAAAQHPLSTFSIDVDRASYANVRRFLREGRRPPVDAVRIEELVNYFSYADPAPRGGAPFSVTTEVMPAPWQPLHRLVRIGLKGAEVDTRSMPPNNLVFLLDVSGSMNSPDKLPLLKTAFGMLVEQLRPQDRVAIVVYAGASGLVLESTPGDHKERIREAIERLSAGGSTAGGAGLELAYRVAAENHVEGGNNRILLATDGDFNVGPSSDAEMVRLVEKRRDQGTFLTVLGFGTGNLKDSKMEQIADHGNGSYHYIDSALEARKVLVTEMGGTLLTIAKDVKIQVEFNPTRVAAYRLIGYENRLLAAEDFDDDRKDAGELGAGHSVTALYEVVPVGVDSPVDLRTSGELRYGARAPATGGSDSTELLFVKLRWKRPDADTSELLTRPLVDRAEDRRASDDLRFAAAVAGWGMLLRDSDECGDLTLADVERLAVGALGDDPGGYRAEFLSLVRTTEQLELLGREPGR